MELHYDGWNIQSWFSQRITKNQQKVRKHTPQIVAILFNLSVVQAIILPLLKGASTCKLCCSEIYQIL